MIMANQLSDINNQFNAKKHVTLIMSLSYLEMYAFIIG